MSWSFRFASSWGVELVLIAMTEHLTPYQLILGTATLVYAIRHVDDLFGLGGTHEPFRVGLAEH